MRYGLNSRLALKILATGLLLLFITLNLNATNYYTRSSGANWNVNNSWSTVTYAGTAATSYPVAGDTVNIADGITIYINTNSACAALNIGQGTSGIVQYYNNGSWTLTVSGNITINNGATLWYHSPSNRTHTLNLSGNLINNGTVNFVYATNQWVNITFAGATNTTVSGSGTWTLNDVTMNKSSTTATVDVQCSGFEAAIVRLINTEGTYIHDNAGSYSVNSASAADDTINQNTVFKVPQGTVTFAAGADILYLYGQLYIDGGNVYVGSTAGIYGFRYQQVTGVPYLEISAGTLTAYGGFNTVITASTDPISVSMSGGTIFLNSGSTGTVREIFNVNDVSASTFQMSGGTIILQTPNGAGSGTADFVVCGTNGTVNTTGGTVQFGNSSTGNNKTFSFKPFFGIVQPNFWVTGPSGNAITLSPANGSTSDFKLLSLKIDANKTFDVRSYGGTNGDTKNMTLTYTPDDVYGFYNSGTFTARSGTVTFSSSAPQSIGGATTTSFYNLTINMSGYNVTLASPESVTNALTMTSGLLVTTATDILTCTSTASANIGNSTSYVDGPMIHTVATPILAIKTFPIGKGTDYRPAVLTVTHLNFTSVTYQAEVINSSATALGYNLPASLASVSNTRYWNFARQNVANLLLAVMQLYYSTDDSVTNAANLRLAQDNGSGTWVNEGGTGTANTTGNITSINFASFNTKFALAFPPGSLPVELLGFDAKNEGNVVLCEWSTASEINNHYFTVERSADGINYDSILSVSGAGNSTSLLNYSAIDDKPLTGDSYYRLRQTDYDGNSGLSKAVHVYRDAILTYTVFPNPSRGNAIFISRNGADMNNVKVTVQDIMGKDVETTATLSPDKKEMKLLIASAAMKSCNMLILSMLSPDDLQRQKVMINKH